MKRNFINRFLYLPHILCLTLFLSFFCLITAYSQQYNIKHYTTKNGLAQSYVNYIFLDSKGYLWLATQGGLSRFDGKNFKSFSTKDGLPGIDLTCIAEDNEGNLWIATNGYGVSKFTGSMFVNYSEKDGLSDNIVTNIFVDNKKNIWFATHKGITIYKNKQFSKIVFNDSELNEQHFWSITEDDFGNMWFGTRKKGLVKYNSKKQIIYNKQHGLTDVNIFSLYYKNGTLWVGTVNSGINFYDGETFKQLSLPGIENEFIGSIRSDRHGNIWFGTDHQLIKYNSNEYKYFTEQNGLSSSTIYSLCVDNEGNLWVGTDNGLNLFKNESLVHFGDKDGLNSNKITALLRDSRGNLLIGTTSGGISYYDGEKIHSLNYINEIKDSKILFLYEDSKGRIWVGSDTWEYGIVILQFRNGKYYLEKYINKFKRKEIKTVSSVIEDNKQQYWISTYGSGIFVINPDSIWHISEENEIPSNNILTSYKDKDNNLWFSLYQNGLVKYDGKNFINISTENGLYDNVIWTITQAKNGTMYFGSNQFGIISYDGKTFRKFNTENNLCSDFIQAVTHDDKGNIWAGTDKGVDRITFSENGNILNIKHFDENTGLKGTEINQNALYFDKQTGLLWMGTVNGLVSYNENYDYINNLPPIIILKDIRLFYEKANWEALKQKINNKTQLPEKLELSFKKNHLTFVFQALTTDNVTYSYLLEGLDDDWTQWSERTEAVYANIPPGNYIFKVKAKNSDYIESEKTLEYSFKINPPYWQTWWFRVLIATLLIIIILLIFRWRTAQLAKEKKLLEEKVNIRTSELSRANANLSVALNDIKDSIQYAKRIQDSILPTDEQFTEVMGEDSFVLFKPKDIVSGDFYWISPNLKTHKNITVYATCDCTGHGVPGGFMTMLGSSFLNEIVNEKGITEPNRVLDLLRDRIILALKQTGAEGENKDGMDMTFCILDRNKLKLYYSAANNGFYIIRNGILTEYKPDKQPIGYFNDKKPFTCHILDLQEGDVIYTFTDGYADQFGGPKGKKFKYKQLEETLLNIYTRNLSEQKEILNNIITQWMSKYEQVDDMLIIGLKV
jgi:ligand-binding sensor domain-containing protein/serine phosphatase RsbU (regulator of sigma subunit)